MANFSDFGPYGYQDVQEIGRNREGGRITYKATSQKLNVSVIIKQFCFAQVGSSWSGFNAYEREIEALKRLDNPLIPRYIDSFETPDGFCLVQEYKNAPSFAEKFSELSLIEIKYFAASLLKILVYLQKNNPPLIHRDIKPDNVLIDSTNQAYLIDFGLARLGTDKVANSTVSGTSGFMSPEQLFNRPLTKASDLYSVGATLICALTETQSGDVGHLIDDKNRFNYRGKIKKKSSQLDRQFLDWLDKMVAHDTENRYPDAKTALDKLLSISVIKSDSMLRSENNASKVFSVIGGIFVIGFVGFVASKFIVTNPDLIKLKNTKECIGCNLKEVDMAGWQLDNVSLIDVDLEGANLKQTEIGDAKLVSVNLKKANLHKARFWNAKWQSVNLEGANLEGATLRMDRAFDVNLKGANLEGATLFIYDKDVNLKLGNINLKGANLKGATLCGNFRNVNFESADSRGVDFSSCNYSNLSEADLSGANLKGANLKGANLPNYTNMQGAIMPDGTIFNR